MSRSLTRVLILSSLVTLTSAAGTVEGIGGEPAAVEDGSVLTKQVVAANSEFAVSLYRQLAKENQGKNLFFSPYPLITEEAREVADRL